MPWVRLDDHFPEHPKLHIVGALGIALQVRLLCYCSRNLTDGRFSLQTVEAVCADIQTIEYEMSQGHADTICKVAETWAERMVNAGLWESAGNGKYRIHDYQEYQPSRAQVIEQRTINAQKQARHRNRNSNPGSTQVSNRTPVPDPVLKKILTPCEPVGSLPSKPSKKPPDPNIKRVIDGYHDAYKARHGSVPPINGKTGKIAAQILSGRPIEEALWAVKEYFSDPPAWYFEHDLWGLEHVLSALPSLLTRSSKP